MAEKNNLEWLFTCIEEYPYPYKSRKSTGDVFYEIEKLKPIVNFIKTRMASITLEPLNPLEKFAIMELLTLFHLDDLKKEIK